MQLLNSFRQARRKGASVCAALLFAGNLATADVIGSFVLNGDGSVTYFYTVDNTAGLFDVALWSLEFEFASPDWDPLDTLAGGDVTVPDPNWIAGAGIPTTGASAQDFLSIDPAGDVLVGAVLGGFSFTSRFLPGTVNYFEFSALGDAAGGTTVGPVPPVAVIPEAGGWIGGLALAGLATFAASRRLGREKARDAHSV